MSYKTFEFKDGKIIISEPSTDAQRKRTFMAQADKDADAFIDSGADCDEKGNYDWDEQEYGSDLSFLDE